MFGLHGPARRKAVRMPYVTNAPIANVRAILLRYRVDIIFFPDAEYSAVDAARETVVIGCMVHIQRHRVRANNFLNMDILSYEKIYIFLVCYYWVLCISLQKIM